MGQNITWLGASYTGVEQVELPQTGGGTVTFYEYSSGGGITTKLIFPSQSVTATTADSSGYTANITVSENLINGENYIVTMDGTTYLCYARTKYGGADVYMGDDNVIWGTPSHAQYPFLVATWGIGVTAWGVADTSAHTVKIERVVSYEEAVLGSKNITANGTYSAADDGVDGYSDVTVSVSNSYSSSDEGKVVSNGTLVAQTAHAQITANGTYDTTTNDSVTVAVASSGGSVDTKTLTNSSDQATSLEFTGMKGTPKAFVLRCTSQLTRSSSYSYYYITAVRYNGTNTRGNYWRRSNGTFYNDTSHYSYSYSGTTLTISSSASRGAAGGSFYNGGYELVYVY